MTKQKTPHTQTQQNRKPEESDLEAEQSGFGDGEEIYDRRQGAETGLNRSPRKVQTDAPHHQLEPEAVAHEGSVSTRTPKKPAQGISSHSAEEESKRQEKVVTERPDAQAGVNHSK